MRNDDLDLSQLPKELQHLLKVAQDSKEAIHLFEGDFDWNMFLDLAFHHRLFPGLGGKMKFFDVEVVPPYVIQKLKKWHQSNTFHMLHLTAEMEYLNQMFFNNGIDTLFLKGPILGQILYGDIAHRTSSDVDILVPINRLKSIEKNLVKMGYIKDDYIESILNDWKWRHHHFTFFHPEKKVKLEVHWRLNPGPGKEPPFSELWERKQAIFFTSTPIYYLGSEELFFFLVTHGARHGWSRLRWLVDLDHLIRKPLDWHRIKSLFKTYNHLPVAGQVLILTNQLLDTPIDDPTQFISLGEKAKQYSQDALFYMKQMIHLHEETLPQYVSRYHKRHLISLMSIHQKLLFYLSFFFPYPEDAATLSLPRRLHYLYFILRPFLWTWRKQKSLKMKGVKG
jgi:hypothetical protein